MKRQATGHFYSPAEDSRLWGAPDAKYTFEVKATKSILKDSLCPLFLYIPKGSNGISLDQFRIDHANNFPCFTTNKTKLFVLYRPYSNIDIFSEFNDKGQYPVTLIFNHDEAVENLRNSLGLFNFSRVTEPYRAAHEFPLFLLHKMGMGFLEQLPGVYNGKIDFAKLDTMLKNAQPVKQCLAIER